MNSFEANASEFIENLDKVYSIFAHEKLLIKVDIITKIASKELINEYKSNTYEWTLE